MNVRSGEANKDYSVREFEMTTSDFERIRKLAYNLTGISLSDHKRNMIYGRLARRVRRLKLYRFSEYCDLIESKGNEEVTDFINAITTNLTSFFRENHHFEYLRGTLIPKLISDNNDSRRIRIWSAGCSTGEEPYSIAMVLKGFPQIKNWDVKVLATDLDTNVVRTAKRGRYSSERVEGVADQYKKYMTFYDEEDQIQIKPEVQSLITFKPLNLLKNWPMKGPFDVIFCRNVVIYFDAETQRKLFDRYANILKSDGKLFIGHSESLHNITDRFESLGRTIYGRKS